MAASGLPSHTIGAIIAGAIDTDGEYGLVVELTRPFETRTCNHWAELLLTLTPEELAEFHARNRYGDVLSNPDKHVRLTLPGDSDPLGKPDTRYFNGDIIRLPGNPFSYLQMQAPTEHTVNHFWLVVFERGVNAIAMLTQFFEKGKEKAIRYWPCVGETIEYGPIHVMCSDEYPLKDWPNITVRAFSVQDSRAAATSRSVVQLHYTAWPDYGVVAGSAITVTGGATVSSASSSASAAGLDEFEAFVERWRELTADSAAPPIVHCSAGLGRAGTFIAIDYLIRTIQERVELAPTSDDLSESIEIVNAVEISPADVVTAIRTHRAGSVQSAAQYAFIYEFVQRWTLQGHCE